MVIRKLRERLLGNLFPASSSGAFEHGIADFLRFECISERGAGWISRSQAAEKIGNLVNEAAFVADGEAWHPPVFHIGMITVGHMDISPSANRAPIVVVEELQPMKIVKVPTNTAVLAVNFEGVQRFVATCVAGRLEKSE